MFLLCLFRYPAVLVHLLRGVCGDVADVVRLDATNRQGLRLAEKRRRCTTASLTRIH